MQTVETSTKIGRWMKQARDLGLEVEFNHEGDEVIQSLSLKITRVQVDVENAFDAYQNSREVLIFASRTFNRGMWTHKAYRRSLGTKGLEPIEKLSTVEHSIRSLAID